MSLSLFVFDLNTFFRPFLFRIISMMMTIMAIAMSQSHRSFRRLTSERRHFELRHLRFQLARKFKKTFCFCIFVQFSLFAFRLGISKSNEMRARDLFSLDAPTPHRFVFCRTRRVIFLRLNPCCSNARRILRAMQVRKPLLLEGSPGVGKTSLVKFQMTIVYF